MERDNVQTLAKHFYARADLYYVLIKVIYVTLGRGLKFR